MKRILLTWHFRSLRLRSFENLYLCQIERNKEEDNHRKHRNNCGSMIRKSIVGRIFINNSIECLITSINRRNKFLFAFMFDPSKNKWRKKKIRLQLKSDYLATGQVEFSIAAFAMGNQPVICPCRSTILMGCIVRSFTQFNSSELCSTQLSTQLLQGMLLFGTYFPQSIVLIL